MNRRILIILFVLILLAAVGIAFFTDDVPDVTSTGSASANVDSGADKPESDGIQPAFPPPIQNERPIWPIAFLAVMGIMFFVNGWMLHYIRKYEECEAEQ